MTTEPDYYALPDKLTDLSDFKEFTDWLSPDPHVIFQVAQGLIVHDMWLERYGVKDKPEQWRKVCTTSASDMLRQVTSLREDGLSLAVPRSPEERIIACCREFTVLATALFRAKGIPARARCGFALYLAEQGNYEDHWMCEYWNGKDWIAIDPQIDPFQQSVFQNYASTTKDIDPGYKEMLLSLDPMHLTEKHFINAGIAWKLYREGKADPGTFGIGADPKKFNLETLYGAWFIRGQLLRDFAALNKVEPVPFLVRLDFGQDWKAWRLLSTKDKELSEDDLQLLDTIADLCVKPDGRLKEINQLFADNEELQPLL
jgi:hypothetical protein